MFSVTANEILDLEVGLVPNIINQALSEEIQVNLPEIIVQVLKSIGATAGIAPYMVYAAVSFAPSFSR